MLACNQSISLAIYLGQTAHKLYKIRGHLEVLQLYVVYCKMFVHTAQGHKSVFCLEGNLIAKTKRIKPA